MKFLIINPKHAFKSHNETIKGITNEEFEKLQGDKISCMASDLLKIDWWNAKKWRKMGDKIIEFKIIENSNIDKSIFKRAVKFGFDIISAIEEFKYSSLIK